MPSIEATEAQRIPSLSKLEDQLFQAGYIKRHAWAIKAEAAQCLALGYPPADFVEPAHQGDPLEAVFSDGFMNGYPKASWFEELVSMVSQMAHPSAQGTYYMMVSDVSAYCHALTPSSAREIATPIGIGRARWYGKLTNRLSGSARGVVITPKYPFTTFVGLRVEAS